MRLRATFFLAFAACASLAFGQSLSVVTADTEVGIDHTGWEVESHIEVRNDAGASKDILVKRVILSEVNGSVNYFCWTNCYLPATDQAPDNDAYTMQAGETVNIFTGYYRPQDNAGSTVIRYVFFDKNNPSDSTYHDVTYKGYGLDFQEDEDPIVHEPYPNPANDETIFEFELPNSYGRYTLSVYDMLGNQVKYETLDTDLGKLTLFVGDLSPGVYFYSINDNGSPMMTKKLIVNRN